MVDEIQRQRQTPQTSNAMDNYYGFGRGLDLRNPGDLAIQRAQSYPSNRQPLLNQPPMQRPSQPQQRPHVNPRMRHINQGMMGGLGGLKEKQTAGLWQDIKRILSRTKNPGPLIDQWTDHWNQTADASGIGSTDEYQMAELTQDQMNMMGNPLNTPDFGVSKEDLFDRVKGMEDKGFFGWGAQEPTTQEEYDDYYNKLLQGEVGNWVT